ncbi:MAG TPA: hypothetical protein VGV18_10420, partial [Verrucomicrobiae bacterium]|nr:hypothetical protein [Verrucomicrobiae bacterium]
MPAQQGQGVEWTDPRDIHEVIVDFAGPIPASANIRVEYWGSEWPRQHLPGDVELGSGFSGWMELGDWYNGGWRVADTRQTISSNSIHFTFAPINAREYPDLTNYSSTGRFTLKIRIVGIVGSGPLPRILKIHALTDSTLDDRTVRIAWKEPPGRYLLPATAFNGRILSAATEGRTTTLRVQAVVNRSLNTFDRTLVTIRNGANEFTFAVDDLTNGALYLPEYGAAILPGGDHRPYATVADDVHRAGQKTLYDRIAEMPEQTWPSAWNGMPPKKSRIDFVLGINGGRQKFRLEPDGNITFRVYDQYMESVTGKDTPRLDLEKSPITVHFGLPEPIERHIQDDSLPICVTTWERDGVRITQTAFATTLDGAKPNGPPPSPDACAVAVLRFDFTNTTGQPQTARLPMTILSDTNREPLRLDGNGLIWNGDLLRGQLVVAQVSKPAVSPISISADARATMARRFGNLRYSRLGSPRYRSELSPNPSTWTIPLAARETLSVILKLPYLPLVKPSETTALTALNFERERRNTARYWRRVLDQSARLITPEPELTEF